MSRMIIGRVEDDDRLAGLGAPVVSTPLAVRSSIFVRGERDGAPVLADCMLTAA